MRNKVHPDGLIPNNPEDWITNSSKPNINSEITVTVKVANVERITLKIKRNSLMSTVFSEVSHQIGVPNDILNFMFNGKRLEPKETPSMVNMNDEDQIDCQTSTISVIVRAPIGDPIDIKVKKDTKMDKIFNATATSLGIEKNTLRFVFDGGQVRGEMTPYMLKMVDGDEIFCDLEQCGD
jgi:small ubiquitin-related modifier